MEAPPNLFGSEFAKRSKEFMEQVKALCSTLPPRREQDSSKKFFQQVPSKRVGQRPGRGRASYAYRGRKQN